MKKHLVICLLLISVLSCMTDDAPTASSSSSCEFPAIYTFGDSNSDTGGSAAAFYPMAAPSGETYFNRPAGRASDGRLIIDFIAEHLGMPFLSPYLDSVGSNFRKGANFATGGATIRWQNESWFVRGASPFSLEIQAAQFAQFKDRTTFFYQENGTADKNRLPKPEDFSKALYVFDIGQNDVSLNLGITRQPEELNATFGNIINQFAAQIGGMYWRGGARTFWIHNTGPIGCLPIGTTKVQSPPPAGYLDQHGCIKHQNGRAKLFNSLLKDSVTQLREKLPAAAITLVDVYSAKYGLISNASSAGFESPGRICCGIHEVGFDLVCGNQTTVKNGSHVLAGSCEKPSAVISWDGVHYTEAANHWVANRILDGALSDPPIPITGACHRQ